MAESSVDNIDGVPFWGHGTEENLLAGITPNQKEYGQETDEEDVAENDGDEEETEDNEGSGSDVRVDVTDN